MVAGTGRAIPEQTLTNADLAQMVETNDQWIVERTGMKERHIASEGIFTSDLAAEAANKALAQAGVPATAVEVIIVATITGDMPFPSTACFVQQKIGAKNAVAFDIAAACSGFIYGLILANSLIQSGAYRNILVIGVEILSRITDYTDRNTCVLFGDGAGAALLQPSDGKRGILGTYWLSDGNLSHLLYMPGGGSQNPATHQSVDERLHYIKMAGREVFKFAVNAMSDAALQILNQTGLSGTEIDLLITHQANDRIIQATATKAKVPPEKVFVNIQKYGNTSAASIPIALDEALEMKRLVAGQRVMLVAFGGGFTWGSAIIQF
ncbi:ketoacyl-ACP synthase III [candidate division KSB1 bacterium]|nr:ketoacyl-ACP synthase III [candidate division KSB1 bacterium]